MHPIRFRLGLCPRSRRGSLKRSRSRPPSCILWGPTYKGKKKRGRREGKRVERRKGEGKAGIRGEKGGRKGKAWETRLLPIIEISSCHCTHGKFGELAASQSPSKYAYQPRRCRRKKMRRVDESVDLILASAVNVSSRRRLDPQPQHYIYQYIHDMAWLSSRFNWSRAKHYRNCYQRMEWSIRVSHKGPIFRTFSV